MTADSIQGRKLFKGGNFKRKYGSSKLFDLVISGVLLGVWKPISPSKVCDYHFAVMDATTFDLDHDISFELP